MQPSAAVNVDVDSLYLYYRLHDLDESMATNAVWERGVVRFQELFAELGIHATFFVVSSDLERWPIARAICESLHRDGHEIASHSHTHPYDLTRLDRDAIAEELERSHHILSAIRGCPVTGFRAPGYTMNQQVYDLLAESGYTYSSSLFPSPPYYLAKAAVMAKMRLFGKKSQAILGHPRWVFNRRLLPHAQGDLREFPVTVLPWHRFPFIGTSLLMMGDRGYQRIRKQLMRRPFINLEFHGIDLCDLEEDGIDPALLKQPDLRVALDHKQSLFRTVLTDLRDHHGVQTLEALATQNAR
jgi:hypothetical protein